MWRPPTATPARNATIHAAMQANGQTRQDWRGGAATGGGGGNGSCCGRMVLPLYERGILPLEVA